VTTIEVENMDTNVHTTILELDFGGQTIEKKNS
jgi:hypothetical protein